jgi:hypothetical protein
MKKPNIKNKIIKMYNDAFLKVNNLKIGDVVDDVNFYFHKLHTVYKSTRLEKVNHYKKCKAVLKVDNENRLYYESVDDLIFYELKSNGLTGRSYRERYVRRERKGIVKFDYCF